MTLNIKPQYQKTEGKKKKIKTSKDKGFLLGFLEKGLYFVDSQPG